MREDGADADSVGVPPMHSRLLAAPDDENSTGGLDMAGSDEKPVFPKLAVAHVGLAFAQISQFLESLRCAC